MSALGGLSNYDSWKLQTPEEAGVYVDPDERDICAHPGRHGCGQCEGCEAWADREISAREDREPDGDRDRDEWIPYDRD